MHPLLRSSIIITLVMLLMVLGPLLPIELGGYLVIMIVLAFGSAAYSNTPGHEQSTSSGTSHNGGFASIVEIVRKMPIEDYVTQDVVNSDCSIRTLKAMLRHRQASFEHLRERSELVEKLNEVRKFNETCCICCEDYEPGDPLRVLTKCKHDIGCHMATHDRDCREVELSVRLFVWHSVHVCTLVIR